ncbi:ribosomal large subunit biogenesis [Trichomonas vaginalis G3]|uniref:ribosomal large subunit biogenesis n=1 Tax=Trichomonas vaginalis (strain ATCC PRA-98 / G3) TaxID=412133 RepID=UPI0021E54570|nr:ribosomal large subunit biogenesis [Trichomonas vaginalis G3]KAI5529957.1 ribosomal large subunit biogenesis [Trichomonas vaginalis G3]
MTLPCNTCRMRFESRALLTEHYHSELHRTNLVLKSRGQDPITEEQFIALQKKKEEEAAALAPPQPEMPPQDEEEDKEEFHYELCRDKINFRRIFLI